MNRFFVNVLILGCIVGIVFAMPASAQVSYFLKWDGLIALWHAMFKNDPTDGGWPIQEGSTLNIGVSLYRQIGNQSYRVIPENEGLLNLADLDVFSGFIWELVGQTSDHPDNHYVSVEAGYGLSWAIVQYYAELGSGQNLVHINDCSLEWGGLFDIEADWASPHSSHRKGDQTDLRYWNLTAAERTVLEEKILNMGGQILIHGVDSNKHYHVDWSGRR